MRGNSLFGGVLDTSGGLENAHDAARLRDFTMACTRFDFGGPMGESESVDGLLAEACASGRDYCLVLSYGAVPLRFHDTRNGRFTNLFAALAEWTKGAGFLVAGIPLGAATDGGLDELCLLVDLRRYQDLGRPGFLSDAMPGVAGGGLIAASRSAGLPVPALDETVHPGVCDLRPRCGESFAAFRGLWGGGIEAYARGKAGAALDAEQRRFIDFVKDQAIHAKSGVFLGNWENYTDLAGRQPVAGQALASVHGVAAGFKVNRILETHGFDDRTRVVFFDYSDIALDVRRMMVETWDGRDFPAFAERIAERFPDAYFQIKGARRPGTLDRDLIREGWTRELDIWGGAEAFRDNWRACRALPHQYVQCDLYGQSQPLLSTLSPEPNSVLWWSNAFHSLNAVWHYEREARERIYHRWLADVAAINPHITLYGTDVDNLGIGGTRVRDHLGTAGGVESLAAAGT
ncbi:hypothetical protein [Ferruginivarius sediminum]|uniref:Uncharacterized protein n=1 Tax=Ferruginivarius sediminum TaxID=2661937 RepID=A0A369T9D1_9PROT|nr:hypothetical protein [Ferruginivarius sediminum]RDD61888.1 hypothetical protein DRB17_10375 [Ferruginivarius sediminum]